MDARTFRALCAATIASSIAAGFLACSSNTPLIEPIPDGGPGDATIDSGGPPDTGVPVDSGGDQGTGLDAGDAADGGGADGGGADAASVSCAAYCTAMQASCTGIDMQYQDMTAGGAAECQTACSLLPSGTLGDTSGNTRGCRITQAQIAQSTGVQDPYCFYAGPFGYGGCGDPCPVFCGLALAWCSPDAGYTGTVPYDTMADCLAACATYRRKDQPPGSAGDAGDDANDAAEGGGTLLAEGGFSGNGGTGDTLDCREFHLLLSMAGPAVQNIHCPEVAYAQLPDAAPGFPCTGP